MIKDTKQHADRWDVNHCSRSWVYLKLPATTTREGLLRNHWDLGAHDGGKECLSETSRPALISVMRPNLPQSAHQFKEEDTLGGIHFLGHKDDHLRPKDRVLNG
jgi:hypothetical protein